MRLPPPNTRMREYRPRWGAVLFWTFSLSDSRYGYRFFCSFFAWPQFFSSKKSIGRKFHYAKNLQADLPANKKTRVYYTLLEVRSMSHMKDGVFKIAKNTQPWWGFTLRQGHIFGMYSGVCYVSAAVADEKRPGRVLARRCRITKNCYRWETVSVSCQSELGRLILDAKNRSPYKGVKLPPEYVKSRDVSTPRFPTFRAKKPTAKPPLVQQPKLFTYTDRIIAGAVC